MYYGKVEICGINTAKLPVLTEKEKTELLDMRLLATVMGEETTDIRSSEITSLLDYGYANYKLDKVLFIPGGKGSTVGSYVIFQMMKNNTAPKAIICLNAEPIIATGAIMSDIPMVD